ncbi:phage tail protein [Acinetobacter dispersus]|uniref:phage tail protein n=1 Tax=Acinetobacter dispersus TaxID=70348 RepID=UPI00132EFA40|nr:phage tail protein [Acinetobacter dispersus]QHH99243.1 hypothetical protein FPL17_17520 [Acinetobacter dispersus]
MIKLAELKTYLSEKLPVLTADKTNLFIVNGNLNEGYLEYTARFLFLDCRTDPILILAYIKKWLRENNLHLNAAQKEIELSFSSEIIDLNTFDLEVDFPQREKVNISDTGYSICKPMIWDDHKGFIKQP